MGYEPEFKAALEAATVDFERFGEIGDTEMTEAGEMRVVGISRRDTVALCNMCIEEFGADLMAGGDKLTAALHGILELSLATGVRLERARWEAIGQRG